MAAFFAMTWLMALRVGDALRIATSAVNVQSQPVTVTLRTQKNQEFLYGERVMVRAGRLAPRVVREVQKAQAEGRPLLFPFSYAQVVAQLKRIDPHLTGHSIRRGVLQALDVAGAPEEVVLAASQHSNALALQRYIDRASSSRRDLMLQSQQRW